MLSFEIHQRFKGHFLNELRVYFNILKLQSFRNYSEAFCENFRQILFVIFALSIAAVFWYFLIFLSPRCRNKNRTDFNGLIMTSQYIDLQ